MTITCVIIGLDNGLLLIQHWGLFQYKGYLFMHRYSPIIKIAFYTETLLAIICFNADWLSRSIGQQYTLSLSKENPHKLKMYPSTKMLMKVWSVMLLPSWLTHWGPDKMAAISQTTFSNVFSWMKMYEFRLRFHWSLFPRVQLTIFQHWFR